MVRPRLTARRLSAVPRRVRLLAGVLLALVIGQLAVVAIDGVTDELGPADLAVVLGTKVGEDGRASDRLRARLDRGAELYRQGLVPRIVVSGGRGRSGFEEADVMRDYLVAAGVPADRVVVDRSGVDTWASARFVADLASSSGRSASSRTGARRVLVVSQFFHVPRAKLAMRRAGLRVGGVHADYYEPRDVWGLARELPAWYLYLLRPA
jgi:vancomycin permeability regulator SanA